MLDIETLGVRPGFVVASAALVRFSDLAATSLAFNVDEQKALGLEIDPETLEWWRNQSQGAQMAAFGSPVPLRPALDHVTAWLSWASAGGDFLIWCHGASFDAPMLQEVYRRAGVAAPWSFRDVRDTRTLYELAGVNVRGYYGGGEDHVALYDAMSQTRAANDALRVLAGRVGAA
jgi:hypothetical protein